jgi:hypothetical protein
MEGLAIGRASLVFNWKNCKMVGTPAPDVAFLGLPTFFFSLKIGCRLPALVFRMHPYVACVSAQSEQLVSSSESICFCSSNFAKISAVGAG